MGSNRGSEQPLFLSSCIIDPCISSSIIEATPNPFHLVVYVKIRVSFFVDVQALITILFFNSQITYSNRVVFDDFLFIHLNLLINWMARSSWI